MGYTREEFLELLDSECIVPHFQPIVDLAFCRVLGYETLARAGAPFTNTGELFRVAEEWDLLWEFEDVCRRQGLAGMAAHAEAVPHAKFFVNVSPQVFGDPRFLDEFTVTAVNRAGMEQRRIVMEITEANSVEDFMEFEKLSRYYIAQGFDIALDDFGAGHSSLVTLIAASPRYLKLDRAIISNIDQDAYKQHLVRSMVGFASSVESKLIAEGVERWEELEVLMRMGVLYAQGFLLARPSAEPLPLKPEIESRIRDLAKRFHYPQIAVERPLASMMMRPSSFPAGALTCAELDDFFRHNPRVDHVVLLDNRSKPVGLLPRQHFYLSASGQFGFALVQKKPVERLAKKSLLVVEERINTSLLGRLAMERDREDIYDPILVTEPDGTLAGSITMKDLLTQTIKEEVRIATSANPLTGLPGNTMIQAWLQDAFEGEAFTVVYGDLDHFKEYNDAYGFSQGDDVIKFAAQVLSRHLGDIDTEAHLGHLGGDDYIICSKTVVDEEVLRSICAEFDIKRLAYFRAEDIQRGHYETLNRQGQKVEVPLVTLTLAAVTSENTKPAPYLAEISQTASALKKQVKRMNMKTGRSGFLVDRRHPRNAAEVQPEAPKTAQC